MYCLTKVLKMPAATQRVDFYDFLRIRNVQSEMVFRIMRMTIHDFLNILGAGAWIRIFKEYFLRKNFRIITSTKYDFLITVFFSRSVFQAHAAQESAKGRLDIKRIFL